MRYKVPQDVQREDRIVLFLTLRQLILLMFGGGISYVLFLQIKQRYDVNEIELVLILLPFLFSIAFAFVRIYGVKLHAFILLLIEQALFRPGRRQWISHSGTPFLSMTHSGTSKKSQNKNTQNTARESVSGSKIQQLADILDRSSTRKPPAA